ncbi:MAG: hypothetical protein WDZ46_01970 [Solirubrobacterales bacterium]
MHTEIPVKVNAWVDYGIAPLVTALNEFENIWTLGSCEDEPSGVLAPYPAYVLFSYRQGGREAALLMADLMEVLADAATFCLQSDWRAGNPEPVLTISCPHDQVPALASAVRAASARAGGNRDKELRS